jgi:flagellar P-ring protein precursor FlgI
MEMVGDTLQVALANPDYTSAVALAQAVSQKFPQSQAQALDPASIQMIIPQEYRAKRMEFLALMEQVEFQPSLTARVVLNQKTGTVIAGGDVSISEVAVSHGNLTVEINRSERSEAQTAAAPGAVTQTQAGRVDESIQSKEGGGEMKVLPATGNVQELARSLNALGATPRDIIAIFEAIRKAGALHAELVMM